MRIQTADNYKNFQIHLAVAFSIITVLVGLLLFFQQNDARYQESIERAREDAIRLTRVVAENVELSFLAVDHTIRRAVEREHFNALFGGNLRDDMEHNLKLWANEAPHIDAMLFTDENGIVDILYQKSQSGLEMKKKEPFISMEHFMKHKEVLTNHLLISPLQLSGEDGHHHIIVSRRQERIDGSFGGLIVAIMDGYYLTNFFRSLEASNHTKMVLLLNDRDFLVNDSGLEPSASLVKLGMENAELVREGGTSVSLAEKYINDDFTLFSFGRLRHLPITIALITDEGGVLRDWQVDRNRYAAFMVLFVAFIVMVVFFLLFMARQIQQVKKSEQKALIASQSKSEFLAKMSHELRTPLNAVIGFSEMLSSGCFGLVNNYQKERLRDINMCGNHLLEFVNDILDFSKGEAGKTKLRETNVEVVSVVKKALRVVSQKAEIEGVKIIDGTVRDKTYIYADALKVKQILLNLLTNAIKFTPTGGRIRVATHFEEDGSYAITVSDTGIGMAPEDIPKAMEVFEQVHKEEGFEGTGLGLPLCKMLAELHGGKITIKSKLGIGTRVSFVLPKKRVMVTTEKIEEEAVA